MVRWRTASRVRIPPGRLPTGGDSSARQTSSPFLLGRPDRCVWRLAQYRRPGGEAEPAAGTAPGREPVHGFEAIVSQPPRRYAAREPAASHSSDYVDWSQGRLVRFSNLKPKTTTISLRLPAPLLADLKALANTRDVPYQSLLNVFVAERVAAEQRLPTKRPQRSVGRAARHRRAIRAGGRCSGSDRHTVRMTPGEPLARVRDAERSVVGGVNAGGRARTRTGETPQDFKCTHNTSRVKPVAGKCTETHTARSMSVAARRTPLPRRWGTVGEGFRAPRASALAPFPAFADHPARIGNPVGVEKLNPAQSFSALSPTLPQRAP
jgi:predicted DNA binding CopG/RHH family protein